MEKFRTSHVFIPGGMPKVTYIKRDERKLEERLRAADDNLCKLVTITGSTKSGKTVLTNTVFPRIRTLWVDGGSIRDEDDLWHLILDNLGGHTEISQEKAKSSSSQLSGTAKVGVDVPLLAHAGIEGNIEGSETTSSSKTFKRESTPRTAAITLLRKKNRPIIIDDFHYIDRKDQGNIVRALKPLIFEGLPLVLIAIPHRRYDVIKVEREMTGRLESIQIPSWEIQELEEIAKTGFPLLNMKVDEKIVRRLANEAYGSPHLMQQFCKDLAFKNLVDETAKDLVRVKEIDNALFKDVAEGTGKTIFDRLAKGPRQRSDRMQRKLKNGGTADIYKVTLLALAQIKPGLATIEYEELRNAMRQILDEQLPQAHEITRVLEKMSEIASNDEASISVLDWDREEQKLHITDPFFAFYLKWGVDTLTIKE